MSFGPQPKLGPAPFPPPTNSPTTETVMNVLAETAERLSQIDRNLTAIRERIQPQPDKAEQVRPQPVGIMGTAQDIRGLSGRIMDRCSELDRLL